MDMSSRHSQLEATPSHRTRVYRIFYLKSQLKWSGPDVEVLKRMLAPRKATKVLPATAMYWMTDEQIASCHKSAVRACSLGFGCVHLQAFLSQDKAERYGIMDYEGHLSKSSKDFLATYRKLKPDKEVYDLSQNPSAGRARTNVVSGSLPTFTTSSGKLLQAQIPMFRKHLAPEGSHKSCGSGKMLCS